MMGMRRFRASLSTFQISYYPALQPHPALLLETVEGLGDFEARGSELLSEPAHSDAEDGLGIVFGGVAREEAQHTGVYVSGHGFPVALDITLHSCGEHIEDVETEDDRLVEEEEDIVFLHEDGMAARRGGVAVAVALPEAEELVGLYKIGGCDIFGDGIGTVGRCRTFLQLAVDEE